MSEYIKKEDAEQELQHFCDDMLHHFKMNFFAERARVKDCMDIIRKVPSADVVEVVRCKDCKWFNLNKWAEVDGAPIIVGHEICDFWGGGCKTQKDGYCSYGERSRR